MNSFENNLIKTKIKLLELHYFTNSGHLGGNFSCIDLLMTLYHLVMNPDDQFILSKGHSAAALYVTLWSKGLISDSDLITFTKDNSLLPGHPSGSGIPGLMFSTGSLGHGPSLASGLALSARFKKLNHQVFCVCSDGEWQEGSCWEALTFAVHHKLDNLIILIDQNGLQGFGRTEDVISCNDLSLRLEAFGASVQKINGHDPQAITYALNKFHNGYPKILVLETIKGNGLHFQNLLESHYLPLTKENLESAINDLKQKIIK